MNAAKLQEIKNQLSSVPTEPGVYLWKNAEGEVIYVGKAKQLRARMRHIRPISMLTSRTIKATLSSR